MGKLTTHVLDTATGQPASGLAIELFHVGTTARRKLGDFVTNSDGRVDGALLEGAAFESGVYELVFHAGDYLAQSGAKLTEPRFLDRIPLRFGISDDRHYHVPLLLSPYGYSTYRGS